MYYKVRVDGKVVTRVLYSVIGLDLYGKKDVLGIYLSESEGLGVPELSFGLLL